MSIIIVMWVSRRLDNSTVDRQSRHVFGKHNYVLHYVTHHGFCITCSSLLLPNKSLHEVLFPENLVHDRAQVVVLVVVDRDEDGAVVG